ncbi:NAD(P)H-hydrate dehydratase [Novispirillum sp. DQ9]|uniref:NAD(P)H-hydrate dehydratase n=1 Tax=Novispirillum sp. DQ9 TaxID=3398612 RepID=UPI003C7E2BF3
MPLPPTSRLAAALTVEQMYAADRAAMAAGVPGVALMEAAGMAVALEARRRLPRGRVAVLCGPGNNGGDGFVAARHLERAGWPVRLALLGSRDRLTGDAAVMAGRWRGGVEPLSPAVLDGCVGVIDALFGAGLARPLDGVAAEVVDVLNARRLPCVAVDVPSGVNGDTGAVEGGAVEGCAPWCLSTVTFFRPKPGHLLQPGRARMGHLVVADIGIPESVLDDIAPRCFVNGPALWRLPVPGPDDHKYTRGHAVVVGGGHMTGAGRLAARAARRGGAGLVTVAAPSAALPLYAGDAPGVLTWPAEDFAGLLADARRNALLLGPGGGRGEALRGQVLAALATGRGCVLDADALTTFADRPDDLFGAFAGPVVLTPHDGEFARLFGPLPGSRLERARAGAARSGAVVLRKGPDTVVAAPDGLVAVTVNAPADLATAGAGDVLAGLIVGLMAQGLDAFAAACAGAWLHAEAARRAGPGLIAEDLPDALPEVVSRLRPTAH